MIPGTGRPRSLRAMHRLSACAVALLWCAAPILAALHAGAEVHRYCAEHGAVEEASEVAVASTPAEDGAPVAQGAEDGAPAHEDCSFARVCRFGQVLAQIILDATSALEPGAVAQPALVPPARAVAVIVIAPKTSPPV